MLVAEWYPEHLSSMREYGAYLSRVDPCLLPPIEKLNPRMIAGGGERRESVRGGGGGEGARGGGVMDWQVGNGLQEMQNFSSIFWRVRPEPQSLEP
jgi:hypothetical protein